MHSSKHSSRIPHPRRHHRPAPLSCARARHRLPLATSKCSSQLPNAALPIRFAAQGTISSHLQDPPPVSHNDDSPGPSDLYTPRCTTRVPLIHDSFILLFSFSFMPLALSRYLVLSPYRYSVFCTIQRHAVRFSQQARRPFIFPGVAARVMGIWGFHTVTSIAASDRLQARSAGANWNSCQTRVVMYAEYTRGDIRILATRD